jgi:hypothetical protein
MYQKHNKFIVLLLYVDDILLRCNDFDGLLKHVKASLFFEFDMKDLGPIE